MAKKKRTPGQQALLTHLFENYEVKTTTDIHDALKDMFSGALEAMLEGELEDHLGYEKHDTVATDTTNRRNGYSTKKAQSQLGELTLKVPRDREASFDPHILPKRKKDVSGIEEKVLSMYAKGQSQRDIEATIKDIYGFEISHETVSKITDKVIPLVQEFRNRPLKNCYPFIFVDAMYLPVKTMEGSGQKALYTMVGIDIEGHKEVLGFWLSQEESSRQWLVILEEIKRRGVEDILFISLDGLTGLEQAIAAVFPETIPQRCIVHLMRNSTRYLPRKKWAAFAKQIKGVYKAVSLDEAKVLFNEFTEQWKDYASAVSVWERNWNAVENLFSYPDEIRRIIYTTNTIESYHNQLRKVTTRKGSFPSEMALYKLIYLRTMEIHEKWNRPVQNWAKVLNQLVILFGNRITSFIR